jgi:hypothetical protein
LLLSDAPVAPCRAKRDNVSHGFKGFSYNPDAFTQADIDEYVSKYSAPNAMGAAFQHYRAFLWM